MNVKKIRKKLGLTQIELAKKMEVSETTVQNWENGRKNISKSHQVLLKYISKYHKQEV